MRSQSFLRHAAVYGLGTFLIQAAGFFLLPLYTRYLSPEEYGILEVFNRLGEVGAICLLFSGIRQAVLAFHGQSNGEEERRRVIATTLWLLAATTLAGAALITAGAGPLSRLLDTGQPGLLRLAVLATLLQGLTVVLLGIPQARLESGYFALATLSQFLVRVGLCLVLVAGLGLGIWGVVIATAVTSGLYAVGLGVRELARGGWQFDPARLREITRFSLPFLPCGLGFFLLNSGDRFFLLRYGGGEAVGLYALGYKLAWAAGNFSRMPLGMVWCARMYQAAKEPDAPEVFGRMFTRILGAYLFVGLGVCLFQDEIIAFLGGDRYGEAARVIGPVMLAYFFQAAADQMDGGFYVCRRTGLKTPIALASTAVMCLLYAVLIPRYGAMGAALATLGGFVAHALVTRLVSQRVFPVRYQAGRVTAMLAVAVTLWLATRALPVGGWAIPVKGLVWLLGPALLWAAGLLVPDEKAWVAAACRQGILALRSLVGLRPLGEVS